jgi:hypothetical protein
MQPSLVIQTVQERFAREAREANGNETGGVLCGTADGSVIVFAGGPGPHARHSHVSFENDPLQDAQMLMMARHMYGDTADVNGLWHLHPFDMPFLSGTDRVTTRNIHGLLGSQRPLLIGIVCPEARGGALALHLFRWQRESVREEAVPFEIVSPNDPRIPVLMARATATLDSTPSDFDYWHDEGFQFYKTGRGRDRILRELEELKVLGYQVRTFQAYPSLHFAIVATCDIGLIKIVCPPEYPLNPPRIFAPNSHEFVLATLQQWNSDRHLAHVVQECRQLLQNAWPRFLSRKAKEPSWMRSYGN